MTACDPLGGDISGCTPGALIGDVVGSAAGSAWDSVCKSFADSATGLLTWFADRFVDFPNLSLTSIANPLGISKWIAISLAALIMLIQVIRTATTHDGSPLAQAFVGLGKAALAFMATTLVANAALMASDEITQGIINQSLGGNDGFKKKLAVLFSFSNATGSTASLYLILSLVGIVVVLLLWGEMLLRNAAIAVLLSTSPIAAVGQMSEATRGWWTKLVTATAQLIALKPIIALVFAVGFGVLGDPTDPNRLQSLTTMITGLLILLLAVIAWPVIARFFTFASVSAVSGGGAAGLLGFAAGRANAGNGPVGVNPSQFSQATEARTMAAAGTDSGAMAAAGSAGGSAAGGAGAGAAAGGTAGLGAVAAPLAVVAAGVDMAQRSANALSGRMETMAGHGGLDGANPHARPAGYPQYHGSWTGGSSTGARPAADGHDNAANTPEPSSAVPTPPPARTAVMPESRTDADTPAFMPLTPAPMTPAPPTHVNPIEEPGR